MNFSLLAAYFAPNINYRSYHMRFWSHLALIGQQWARVGVEWACCGTSPFCPKRGSMGRGRRTGEWGETCDRGREVM